MTCLIFCGGKRLAEWTVTTPPDVGDSVTVDAIAYQVAHRRWLGAARVDVYVVKMEGRTE